MTKSSTPRLPFPDTAHMIGMHASLEQVGAPRGLGNIAGVILAVEIAPDGAVQTYATVRADDDGQEYSVRVPRAIAQKR